jgi:hypothetical protein
MIRYRAAAFWGRLYIPELLVGIQTEEEVVDVEPVTVRPAVEQLNAKIKQPAAEPVEVVEASDADEIF